METRSRKRAEASSSCATSSSRSSKRSRPNPNPNPPANTAAKPAPAPPRTRRSAAANPLPAMDSSGDNNPNPNLLPRRRGRSSNADKGKEQQQPEPSESSRVREAERLLGLGFKGTEDDDDAGFGAGAIPHSLTSASTALQGLLRKLGAGLDDILPSSALSAAAASSSSASGQLGGRLKKVLVGLRADGEDGRQVEALTQLCEMLSIGTEESLRAFSVDSFVPVLVGLLNHESNPDIMLLAARALTHLCDVLPSSCSAVVHYGAVPCFCARLLTIEYMDLAEQSLQALKKISLEHPTACLRAGALMAVLSYLDFFSTGVQRVALSTAANMCRKLPSDASDFVMEAVPLLTNLLNYHDSKVLEHASVCLTHIVEAFSSSPEKLDELCNHGLVAQAASLISVSNSAGQASLSTSTYTGVIRLLSICASGSPLASKTLLLLGISGILKDVLSGSGLVAGTTVTPTLTRPADQIIEIVKLADELLPPLPVGTISLPMYSDVHMKGSSVKKSTCSKQGEPGSIENELSGREKLLRDQPELLHQFGMDLLPIMTQVYGSSVSGSVRHKCLSVIGKLMYYSSAEMIQSLLSTTNISSFLAGILGWKDPQVLIPALQIAEVLMEKLPEIFLKMFVREGVVHAVELLICPEFSGQVTPQMSQLDNHVDSITSSCSRRNRCRNNAVNTENNLPDEPKRSHSVIANALLSTTEVQNNDLCALVSNLAKSFKDKYFPSEPGSTDISVTDDLLKLRVLCAKLNTTADTIKTKAKGKSKATMGNSFDVICNVEDQLDSIIAEMLSELSKGDGVSTFEFIGSGVVTALLNYLSCGSFGREKVPEANLPNLRHQAVRRYKAFISVALPNYEDGNRTPMALLVQKLQGALSSLEHFPVVLSHSGRVQTLGGSRLVTGLGTLSQPFKLRLCRAPGEKSLKDYSSNIVLIDPLASLAAVEEFLWPRVQRTESVSKPVLSSANNSESGAAISTAGALSIPSATQSARRASLRSKSSAATSGAINKDHQEGSINALKGKGKAVLKSSLDEPKGPHTRNAARRKAASENDVELKPSNGHSTLEDEDLDASPVEIDDALMIDDDDEDVSQDEDADHEVVLQGSRPACVPERVHDVRLGDADDSSVVSLANSNQAQPSSGSSTKNTSSTGLDAAEFRSPSTFGSRGAMSFAAAAMAGLGSRGIRGSRDRSRATEHYNKLIFTAGGKQLNKHLTVYQAVQRQVVHDDEDVDQLGGSDLPDDGNHFWGDVFTVTYQKADYAVEKGPVGGSASAPKFSQSDSCKPLSRKQCTSLLDSILQGELPCDLEKSNQTYNILSLLRVLEGLNQLSPRLRLQATSDNFVEGKVATLDGLYGVGAKVPLEEFVNTKMTPKLARQIQDVLALCSGSLPSWCYQLTKACPFLFPFETRRQYFYSTAFGLSRALHRLQQHPGDNNNTAIEREIRVGRLQRQKVRVSRNRILDSAAKVMEMFSNQKAVLEVEYFGEVGTGLGPTSEFYTLLSHDLQRVDLGLWRSHSTGNSGTQIDGNGYHLIGIKHESESLFESRNVVQAHLGLFPQPWPPSAAALEGSKFFKVVEYFRLVGRVMAKALQDGRLLDLPLSTAFYKLLLGQELELYDVLSFDTEFGKILQELQILVARKRFLESCCSDSRKIEELCFRGAPVEDLCLDFTLPGYPDYVLKEGGENVVVDIYNLEEYISLVVDATVKTGIMRQVEAMKAGFNQVFDISSLQIFSPQELDYLICGRRELWEPEILLEHIKFDHGYTSKSPAIVNFLEIMAEFTPEQQHSFCQFVTGAPRLPPGGLAALNPKLTIVRKHSSSAANTTNATGAIESADDDLPSVMTCANYLKLPPYSTKAIMLKKLLYAINEGQGSFDLS
ncbi:E3 ubiquitin-protein ligase UPL3 isoform X1 [Setaria viridis]|uniref:E3 ubiquitin-protein ligase UPL3 isoform X1 n=1 Tax=Setaria viridis TaxID=4556 RepID=UPI0014938BD8|nr:E3 ubiquitin-protein ligase UPL3-like isoform X1 [Setaria viridis]